MSVINSHLISYRRYETLADDIGGGRLTRRCGCGAAAALLAPIFYSNAGSVRQREGRLRSVSQAACSHGVVPVAKAIR